MNDTDMTESVSMDQNEDLMHEYLSAGSDGGDMEG